MEKDYFQDRHPNCHSLKAVQKAFENHEEVYICEKIMQTVAETLQDLTRGTILAILSSDDHPMGLKVKITDKDGRIRIGRITYFVCQDENQEDCILTKNGLIPIEKILYEGYSYFLCNFKVNGIKNYILKLRLNSDLYFYKEEQMEKYLKEFQVLDSLLFQQLIQIKTNKGVFEFKTCNLFINDKLYKNISIINLFPQVFKLLKQEPIKLQLIEIERCLVN